MDDALPAAPALGAGNSFTSGVQSFAGATALVTPLATTVSADPTANGNIAYDTTDLRYVFGGDGLILVPVVSPQGTGPLPPPSYDTLCANHADTGCTNMTLDATGSPKRFASYTALPAGFFANTGKSVRITYHMKASSSSPPPSLTLSAVWTESMTTTPLFTAPTILPLPSMNGQQFTISCLFTAAAPASTSSIILANCTSTSLGTLPSGTMPTIYTLPILAIPSNATPAPVAVNTQSALSYLDLALYYSANTSGNSMSILQVIPEILQ